MFNKYYIAYGSNLNVAQMALRCPTARFIGVSRIENYRLCFKGGGFCTIEPFEGEYVPVGVWEIKPKDEVSLDIYEGVPTHYFKETLSVKVAGKEYDAMVYIMNLRADYAKPSRSYFDAVLSGYRSFGLNESKLFEALEAGTTGTDEAQLVNRLRSYRNAQGLTLRELSQVSGVCAKRIAKYETGERSLKKAQAEAVIALSDALGVEPRQLLG